MCWLTRNTRIITWPCQEFESWHYPPSYAAFLDRLPVCGDIGDENPAPVPGHSINLSHMVTLPQEEVLQVSTVPTWVKDLIDLIFLPWRQLHRWWGLSSGESWSIMGIEEGDMENIKRVHGSGKGGKCRSEDVNHSLQRREWRQLMHGENHCRQIRRVKVSWPNHLIGN